MYCVIKEKGDTMKSVNRQGVLLGVFLCSFWLYLHPISAFTQKGSIRIHLKHINVKQETIALSLYDVSDIMKQRGQEALEPSKALLKELEQEVKTRKLVAFTHTSDDQQAVEWKQLSRGSYLIIQTKAASYGTMEPLLISLPAQTADQEPQMNVVIEPAVIQTISQDNTAAFSDNSSAMLYYIPTQAFSLQDVLLLFCMFSGTILVLSLWKHQREQREI